MMIAWANARENSTTRGRRSVHQRSLPNALPHAWVRSTGHRLLAWIGAGMPLWAMWPSKPRSARVVRVLPLS
jgi:hypothetical protein